MSCTTMLQNGCGNVPQSCLRSQILDYYVADQTRISSGTTPVYMVAAYGGGHPNATQVPQWAAPHWVYVNDLLDSWQVTASCAVGQMPAQLPASDAWFGVKFTAVMCSTSCSALHHSAEPFEGAHATSLARLQHAASLTVCKPVSMLLACWPMPACRCCPAVQALPARWLMQTGCSPMQASSSSRQ